MVESECCVFKVSPTDPSAMAIRNVPKPARSGSASVGSKLKAAAACWLAPVSRLSTCPGHRISRGPSIQSRTLVGSFQLPQAPLALVQGHPRRTAPTGHLRSVFSLMIPSPSQVLDVEVSPTSDFLRWDESSDRTGGKWQSPSSSASLQCPNTTLFRGRQSSNH